MSINGIRKIKDAKYNENELDRGRFQRLSEFTNSVYTNTYEGVSTGFSSKAEQRKISIGAVKNSDVKSIDRHRKTGSVVLQHDKQKSIVQFVNHDLHIPLSSYKFKLRDRSSNTGSLTSRRQRDTVMQERPLTRLQMEGIKRQIEPEVSKMSFHLGYVVGKGGFGKVWKVKEKKTGLTFAMKEMLKVKIIKKRSVHSVMNEKELLEKLNHPFLVNMAYAFQDTENLFLVMDYLNGGDLRYHMGNRRRFTENESKFIVACIIIALQYLHFNNVIHRDLKPENLVFDREGYLGLTDLGVSRTYKPSNASDTSGTPGYMAPEVICRRDHSFPVDFFALGVIAYQLMLGKRPYVGKNRAQIRDQILAKQVKIQENPKNWSGASVDFINRLIQRKPQARLGFRNITQLKEHEWFRGFDWNSLGKRNMKPPFVPLTIEEDYESYKCCISSDSQLEDDHESKLLLRKPQTQEMFDGYEYRPERSRRRIVP